MIQPVLPPYRNVPDYHPFKAIGYDRVNDNYHEGGQPEGECDVGLESQQVGNEPVITYRGICVYREEYNQRKCEPQVRIEGLPERFADAEDHAYEEVLEERYEGEARILVAHFVLSLIVWVEVLWRLIERPVSHKEEHEGLEENLYGCGTEDRGQHWNRQQ